MCITYLTVRTHTYICTHAYTHTYAHVCILPICIPKCPSVRIHWHLYNCSNHVMSCRQGTGQLVSSLQLDYVLSSVDRSFLHPHKLSSTTRSLHFYYLVLHSCLLCKHLVRRLYVLRALRTSAHTHMHTRANIHTNTRTHTHKHLHAHMHTPQVTHIHAHAHTQTRTHTPTSSCFKCSFLSRKSVSLSSSSLGSSLLTSRLAKENTLCRHDVAC